MEKRSIIDHVFKKFSSSLRGHFSTCFQFFNWLDKFRWNKCPSLHSKFNFFWETISECSLNLAISSKNMSKWEFLTQNAADTKLYFVFIPNFYQFTSMLGENFFVFRTYFNENVLVFFRIFLKNQFFVKSINVWPAKNGFF